MDEFTNFGLIILAVMLVGVIGGLSFQAFKREDFCSGFVSASGLGLILAIIAVGVRL